MSTARTADGWYRPASSAAGPVPLQPVLQRAHRQAIDPRCAAVANHLPVRRPQVVALHHGFHQPWPLRFRLPSRRRARLGTTQPTRRILSRLLVTGPGRPGLCFVDAHRVSAVLIAVSHVRPFGPTAPTMASADFSLRLLGVALSGVRRDLPGYDAPAFPLMPVGSTPRRPCKYRALTFLAASPRRVASYPLPVRQASVLLPASFRHPVTRSALAFC